MKVLALGVIPGNRKPSTGMAWLLIVLLSPLVGFVAFVFFGRAKLERGRHARQQAVNDRLLARTAGIPDLPLDPDLPAVRRVGGAPQPRAQLDPAGDRQRRGAGAGLRGLDPAHGRGGRDGHRLRERRVLHHRVGPRDRSAVRPDGRRDRARGDRPAAVRPPRLPRHPRLPGHAHQAGGDADPVAPDAADPALPWLLPAPRPAQPPQAARGRRPDRLHRVAEPHRAGLQQAEEPRRRARVGRADGPAPGPGRRDARRGLLHRLVHRDRRDRAGRDRRRPDRGRPCAAARGAVPAGAERAGHRGGEQPADVHHADLRRHPSSLADQSVLRARRVTVVRRHHGRPARRRGRAVRERAVRPVHGRACPGLLLPGAARGRGERSTSTPRRTSCTASTSPSTTTSR